MIIRTECKKCGSKNAFMNQPLATVKAKVCELCGIPLAVIGSEGADDPPPKPLREVVYLTKKEQADARRLIESVGGD